MQHSTGTAQHRVLLQPADEAATMLAHAGSVFWCTGAECGLLLDIKTVIFPYTSYDNPGSREDVGMVFEMDETLASSGELAGGRESKGGVQGSSAQCTVFPRLPWKTCSKSSCVSYARP